MVRTTILCGAVGLLGILGVAAVCYGQYCPPGPVGPTARVNPGAVDNMIASLESLKARREAIEQEEQAMLAALRQELKVPNPGIPIGPPAYPSRTPQVLPMHFTSQATIRERSTQWDFLGQMQRGG
jgi:hypothetical protein